jgi:hypothetical protein
MAREFADSNPRDGGDSAEPRTRVVGRRSPPRGGLQSAAPLFDLVVALRRDRPFIPRGLHRFASFEEAQEWSMRMMTRRSSPGRRP